jgi:hypothetical protein
MPAQPKLDAYFLNSALTDGQRRQMHCDATPAAFSDTDTKVQKVREERIERLWGNDGQARVRTLFAIFGSLEGGVTVEAKVVAKSITVPKTIDKSKARAELKHASFLAEAAFLELIPHLLQRSIPVPKIYFSSAEHRTFVFLMEDMRTCFPLQHYSFTLEHAKVALTWLARFHAAFWEEKQISFGGTWAEGTYWNLSKKPIVGGGRTCAEPCQPAKTEAAILTNWAESVKELSLPAPLHCLWATLQTKAAVLDEQLSAVESEHEVQQPTTKKAKLAEGQEGGKGWTSRRRQKHRTMLHGDYKAENILFKKTTEGVASAAKCECAVVDFQWCGSGYGARDVMYLICTSLEQAVQRESAMELLCFYHARLREEVQAGAGADASEDLNTTLAEGEAGFWDYSFEEFLVHYKLSLIDFTRFCISDGKLIPEDRWILDRAAEYLGDLAGHL